MDEDQSKKEKTIDYLVNEANKELIKIKTVWPFTMFPTELIVDEVKLTIITHGFLTKQYFPILLKDLKTVNVMHGLFFATIKFEISGYETNPDNVCYLKKDEALKAQQIILGLTTVHKEKAEKSLTNMSEKEESEKLIEIGGSSTQPSKKHIPVKPNEENDKKEK